MGNRILSRYLDALKQAQKSSYAAAKMARAALGPFVEEFPYDSPEQFLLRGEFQKCVPVLGDDPCAWAFDGAIQQGWNPGMDGIPITSPWPCFFLDVRAPETISWASGAPHVPWDGPSVWGWVVTQKDLGEENWACRADLILPHDVGLGGPCLPAVREWSVSWELGPDGIPGGALTFGGASLPFWRTQEDAEKWTPALTAPLFRTLQLLNCTNIEVGFHRPEPKRRKRGKKRKGQGKRQRGGVVYRVLQVEAGSGHSGRRSSGSSSAGDGALVRRHLRRGHFKRWGYHNLVELEDGTKACDKCGQPEAALGDLCGTGHFGSGRKLVKWINSVTVGTKAAGELEKMYSVLDESTHRGA